MSRFIHGVKQYANEVVQTLAPLVVGTVTGWDPDTFMAKCTIEPDDIPTEWIPVGALSLGPDSYVIAAPVIGSQVLLAPQEHDASSYQIIAAIPNEEHAPKHVKDAIDGEPVKLKPGEFLFTGKGGAVVRFMDGRVYIEAPEGWEVLGNGKIKGDIDVDGYVKATKNVESQMDVKDSKGTLDRLRGNYNSHGHTGVQTGGGTSGATNKTD